MISLQNIVLLFRVYDRTIRSLEYFSLVEVDFLRFIKKDIVVIDAEGDPYDL